MHAFESCNALVTDLPKRFIRQLQQIQNAAANSEFLQLIENAPARILTKTKKIEQISPILSSLH